MTTEPVQISLTLTVANEQEENDAVCELNIQGNEVTLQPVGDQNALDMILQQAQEDQIPRSTKCKIIVYIFAFICMCSTLSDVGLALTMCIQKPNILVVETHSWDFEGPLLVAQALLAFTVTTFAIQIIIREVRISTRVYFSCLAGLVLVISVITGWIFREDSHNHDFRNMDAAIASMKKRIKSHIHRDVARRLPDWLEDVQTEFRCCGVTGVDDWKYLWKKPDVPDSCCIIRFHGCGKNYFSTPFNGSSGVTHMGCLHSAASFSARCLFVMEHIKFAEAFLMIFITLIWLCCWDKFITRQDQELLVRYTTPSSDEQTSIVSSPEPRRNEANDEGESTNVENQRLLQSVESRHSQRGGGDLGTKSEYNLTPKAQDNLQSGDYTEIDPTKAQLPSSLQQINFTT